MKAANDNQAPAELEKVYTLGEAATALRMTNRGVAKVAKRHGLCMVNGRKMLFTAGDIERIKDVLRCPSDSISGKTARTGGSAAPSMDKLSMSLLALSKKKSPKRSAQSVKLAS